MKLAFPFALLSLLAVAAPAGARTVYRCVRDGSVSLATAPEAGARCAAHELDDASPLVPDLLGARGRAGVLYRQVQDGKPVLTTRAVPGAERLLAFSVPAPKDSPAHAGLGTVAAANTRAWSDQFSAAAKDSGIEDAWLRAVAHAESAFRADAVSPKGALGVMQLMPETAKQFRVANPLSASQSIRGGARYLSQLLERYSGDRVLAAAAYNAGPGAVAKFGGVPPYRETQAYVKKVEALYRAYDVALANTLP
ncbi:MAG TPA: lytic transglycosylase domain-containing protein [Xanthomonadales bacterium]|nr:lytic transglycosylase domain-containing protein [Xanthomonadales bacterium]